LPNRVTSIVSTQLSRWGSLAFFLKRGFFASSAGVLVLATGVKYKRDPAENIIPVENVVTTATVIN